MVSVTIIITRDVHYLHSIEERIIELNFKQCIFKTIAMIYLMYFGCKHNEHLKKLLYNASIYIPESPQ